MVVDIQRQNELISSGQRDVNFHLPVGSTVNNISVVNNNATAGAVFSTVKYMNGTLFVMSTKSGFCTGESVTGLHRSFVIDEEYKFPRNVGVPRLLFTAINESGTDLQIDFVVTYEYQPPIANTPEGGRID